jgi:hypothetical protein
MRFFTNFLFLFVFVSGFSQIGGTSEKEYRYLAYGYKEDVEKGKDIIADYKLELIAGARTSMVENNKTIVRESQLHKLVRDIDGKIAAFLLIEKRMDTGFTTYICVPNKSSLVSIWDMATNDYYKKIAENKCENSGAAFGYSWNALKLISQTVSN